MKRGHGGIASLVRPQQWRPHLSLKGIRQQILVRFRPQRRCCWGVTELVIFHSSLLRPRQQPPIINLLHIIISLWWTKPRWRPHRPPSFQDHRITITNLICMAHLLGTKDLRAPLRMPAIKVPRGRGYFRQWCLKVMSHDEDQDRGQAWPFIMEVASPRKTP